MQRLEPLLCFSFGWLSLYTFEWSFILLLWKSPEGINGFDWSRPRVNLTGWHNVSPGLDCPQLQSQRSRRHTWFCIVGLSQRLVHWMKRRFLDSIPICLYRANVIVEQCFAVVKQVRNMITKGIGKSWGIYGLVPVRMKWIASLLNMVLKMNLTANTSMFQGFPMVPWIAVWLSNVDCVIIRIGKVEQQQKSQIWKICKK